MYIDDDIWKINQKFLNSLSLNNNLKEVFENNSKLKDYLEKKIFLTVLSNDYNEKMKLTFFDNFISSQVFFCSYNTAMISEKNCILYQNLFLNFSIGRNFEDTKIIMILSQNSNDLILIGFMAKSEITKTSINIFFKNGVGFLNNGRFIANDKLLAKDAVLKDNNILGKKLQIELIIKAKDVEFKIIQNSDNY